jgi:hypothetical protein
MKSDIKLVDSLKDLKSATTPEELRERRALVIARFHEIIKNAQIKLTTKKNDNSY